MRSPSGSKWSTRTFGGAAIVGSNRDSDGSPPLNPTVPEFEEIIAWGAKRKSSRTYRGDLSPSRFRLACSNPGSILSASSKSRRALSIFPNLR